MMISRIRSAVARAALLTAAVLPLAGCMTVGPDYVPPETDMPDAWSQALTDGRQIRVVPQPKS